MSKRYEVKRFSSCYSLNWVDNKTNKELTAVEIEQIVNNQYQRIAELEAKLEEKDKNALALFSALYDILEEQDPENVSSRIDYLTKQDNGAISDFYKEHKVLKQQLAEKEKQCRECKHLNKKIELNIKHKLMYENGQLEKQLAEKEKDKISFALEQLEKVKEKILSYEEIYYQFSENGAKIPVFCVENFRVRQNIDNQIKTLRGEK